MDNLQIAVKKLEGKDEIQTQFAINNFDKEIDVDNFFINPGLPFTEEEFQALAKLSDNFLIYEHLNTKF